jgi:hypothetical protein
VAYAGVKEFFNHLFRYRYSTIHQKGSGAIEHGPRKLHANLNAAECYSRHVPFLIYVIADTYVPIK